MKNFRSVIPFIGMTLILGACGDESSFEPQADDKAFPQDGSTVESIYDLGKCTSDREGDVLFVKEDEIYYKCEEKSWQKTEEPESSASKDKSSGSKDGSSSSKNKSSGSKDGSSSSKDKSSGSKDGSSSSKDKSSVSKDGSSSSKDGSSASKDGSSSSKGNSSSLNGSSSAENKSSSSVKSSSSRIPESSSSIVGANETVENVAISKLTIKGVAEKGPYAGGSAVRLMELDEALDPTGTSFEWEVSSDLGEFTSTKVTLKNQYALMQATGYYYNENAKAKTSGQATIKSLVDLSGRTTANVNLLGHLAHKRAIYLYTQSGKYKNVPAAKAAAEREVLAAFGWPANNHAFEDLSIFGRYEDDGKLLAASILLQESLSNADIVSRLTTLSTDFEDDGLWSDTAAKVALADWAMDTTRNFDTIRTTLSALGKNVPNFEKYIAMFVGQIYGIGMCTSEHDAEIKKVTNAYSNANLGKNYVCDNGKWRLPKAYEVSYGACTESTKGTYIDCNMNYSCICDGGNGNWRQATVYDYSKESYLNPDYKYGTMKDTRDNRTYKTTTIGTQTWMAENLNYYDEDNPNLVARSWCYSNVPKNCEVGGRLYTWTAAMNLDAKYMKTQADFLIESPHQGICPDGWHVPDSTEWATLKNYVAELEDGYTAYLKSARGWSKTKIKTPSTDAYGFSAIPTGAYHGLHANSSGEYSRYLFDDMSLFANFWAANEAVLQTGAHYWYLDFRYSTLGLYNSKYNEKDRGFSLRCIKN